MSDDPTAEQQGLHAPDVSVDEAEAPATETSEHAGAPESSESTDVLDIQPLEPDELRGRLEALLMVADQPMDATSLAQTVGAPTDDTVSTLESLAQEYTDQRRGFDLRQVGSGWRLYSREDFAAVVEAYVLDGQQARLTQAALETLAVVAYRQPISRARVSAIRGVNVDGVMRTLTTRGLVEEAGNDAETGAHLYATTSYFLERMGLTSIEQLPEIAPFLPEMAEIEGDDELADITPDDA